MTRDLIDFTAERKRHGFFIGREDLLENIDQKIKMKSKKGGWVLLTGHPGMGKSATLNKKLELLEKQFGSGKVPFHFLRRGVADWAQPDVVRRSLAAQVEALFDFHPTNVEAQDKLRLVRVLDRVSKTLIDEGRTLTLVVDGLNWAEDAGDLTLASVLPNAPPPGVVLLASSRPRSDKAWSRLAPKMIDLDLYGKNGAKDNDVCRQYLERVAGELRLTPEYISDAVDAAQGVILYVVTLVEGLRRPRHGMDLQTNLLPRGLDAYFSRVWECLTSPPGDSAVRAKRGLQLLCLAREPLSRDAVRRLAQWSDEEVDDFLAVSMDFVKAEENDPRYQLFHESFREFILSEKRMTLEERAGLHRELARQCAPLPLPPPGDPFRRYALLHGLLHRVEGGNLEELEQMALDLDFLALKRHKLGLTALEADFARAQLCWTPYGDMVTALRAEAHWLQHDPMAFSSLLYTRLRRLGWPTERLEQKLRPPERLPRLRLRHASQGTRMTLRTLPCTESHVSAVAMSRDGRYISCVCEDTLVVWDLRAEQATPIGKGPDGASAWGLTGEGDRVISIAQDGTLRLHTVQELLDVHASPVLPSAGTAPSETPPPGEGQPGRICACAVTPDGTVAITTFGDTELQVYYLDQGGQQRGTLRGHAGQVLSCAITADGAWAVSAARDGELKVWRLQPPSAVAGPPIDLAGHGGDVLACFITADGARVISASADHTLKVWDVQARKELATLTGHKAPVQSCIVTDDNRIFSASADGCLRIWDLRAGSLLAEHHGVPNWRCSFSPDGKFAIFTDETETWSFWDNCLRLWELPATAQGAAEGAHLQPVLRCALSPDGTVAISASEDKTLKLWDLHTGKNVATLEGHTGPVLNCALFPDGVRLLSASADQTLKVWDLGRRTELYTLSGHSGEVVGCAVFPDGTQAVSSSRDGSLRIWDLQSPGSHRSLSLSSLTAHSALANKTCQHGCRGAALPGCGAEPRFGSGSAGLG